MQRSFSLNQRTETCPSESGAGTIERRNTDRQPTHRLGVDQTSTRSDVGGTSTPLIDVLGSALALADASGTARTQYMFDPFRTPMSSGAASSNAVQCAARENDGAGLYYYRARYQAPAPRRFTSEDPIGFRGGINLYA